MPSSDFYRLTGYFIEANSNGKKIIDEIRSDLKNKVDKLGERLLERVCQIFVDTAKYNLMYSGYSENKYEISNLVDNIFYTKYGKNKYRVGIRNNAEKPIMYFLEFGTGAVGKRDPHPNASKIGWRYLINQRKTKSGKPMDGWTYFDEQKGEYVFTKGLKALSYIYDTYQKMDDIIKMAIKEIGLDE